MPQDKRKLPEFNAASMADIAFLLLIFFLLVTTIKTDKGITRKLPPLPEGPPPKVDVNQRNVFIVLVNAQDKLLVEGEPAKISDLKRRAKRFILNPNNSKELSEDPTEAVISLKSDRGTSYDMYIQVQNELTATYNEIRNDVAQRRFDVSWQKLKQNDDRAKYKKMINKIKEDYPMKISEAEPENVGN